jgi:hypothetical protein
MKIMKTESLEKICPCCGSLFVAKLRPKTKQVYRIYCNSKCAATGKNVRHGLRYTPEFSVWCNMRGRCNQPSYRAYASYGGRGIKVCDRWNATSGGMQAFYADMGPRPGPGYSIERIDNDGNYEPSNCKWATRAEQNKNKRNIVSLDDQQKIRDCLAQGMNFRQVGEIIGRTASSVAMKAYRMGLKSGQPSLPRKIIPTLRADRTPEVTTEK